MKEMEHNLGHDGSFIGIVLSLGSILLYILSIFTVSDYAAVFAIGAGASAMLYNLTKWWLMIRKRKK